MESKEKEVGSSKDQNRIELRITKKKPKKNAPVYEINCLDDLFKIATPENKKRLLKIIGQMMDYQFHLQKLFAAVVENEGKEYKRMEITYMTWTDD